MRPPTLASLCIQTAPERKRANLPKKLKKRERGEKKIPIDFIVFNYLKVK